MPWKVYAYACVRMYVCISIYVYMYICMCIYNGRFDVVEGVCVCVYMYTCMYLCTCIYICIYDASFDVMKEVSSVYFVNKRAYEYIESFDGVLDYPENL